MLRLLEDILDFIVHVVFFPYFIIRQYRADMKFLRSFKQEPRETLYDRISRNGGSFGEFMDKEHPFLAKAIPCVLLATLFVVAILGACCGPY